jgi:uncharacterized protein YjiS (DUF1127 family)
VPRDGSAVPHLTRHSRLVRLWRRWRQRIFERRLAAQFSDGDLRDIGLTRTDVNRELSRPFWKDTPYPAAMTVNGDAW